MFYYNVSSKNIRAYRGGNKMAPASSDRHQLSVVGAHFTCSTKCKHIQQPHSCRCHSARLSARMHFGIDSRDEFNGTM